MAIEVQLEDCKISYIDKGVGPIILFIHGWLVPKEGFLPLIDNLSKEFRCIALDLPGFGESSKGNFSYEEIIRLIELFIAKLNLEKPNILGSSMGGSLAIYLVSKDPKKYSKLVLRSPFLNYKQLPTVLGSKPAIKIHQFLTEYQTGQKIYAKIFKFVVVTKSEDSNDNIKKDCASNFDTLSVSTARDLFFNFFKVDLVSKLNEVTNPTLYIYNPKDILAKWSVVKETVTKIPNIIIKESGSSAHLIFDDKANKEANIIKEFLLPATHNS
jgi:pimeloyl-ACP methyl ester carboxylesterase